MSVKRMNLGQASPSAMSGSKILDYALGEERLSRLEGVIRESDKLEFWSPKYQAWRKLLEWYLSSGNNPVLAQTKLLPLLEKEDWLDVPEGPLTQMYRDTMRLRNTSGSELFQDVYYKDITQFCDVQCQFFISQKNRVWRELHSDAIYNDVMKQLLDKGTHRATMCALVLYREHQRDTVEFDPEMVTDLQSRVSKWRDDFVTEFKAIQEMLGDLVHRYSWYCDIVLNAIMRAWDNAFVLHNRPDLVTADENLELSRDTAADLLGYLNACPVGIGPAFGDTSAFDAMYQIYYNNIVDDADNAERCFFALCIPSSKYKTMVDYLYDFYWCVADGLLSSALYARMVVAHQRNKDSVHPDDYLASLQYRGYPELK